MLFYNNLKTQKKSRNIDITTFLDFCIFLKST